MAYFKCTGGLNPTGNATAGDVKSGKTFSNASGVDLTGTFAAQTKTVTSSRTAQTVTPDSGKYLSKVTVNALAPTGTYTASSRGASLDMGETSNYRYVNTNSVPNSNSGTYTFASGSTGAQVDLGATNTYRYVNATNVYAKGKADGTISSYFYGGIGYGGGHLFMYFPKAAISSFSKFKLTFIELTPDNISMGYGINASKTNASILENSTTTFTQRNTWINLPSGITSSFCITIYQGTTSGTYRSLSCTVDFS